MLEMLLDFLDLSFATTVRIVEGVSGNAEFASQMFSTNGRWRHHLPQPSQYRVRDPAMGDKPEKPSGCARLQAREITSL